MIIAPSVLSLDYDKFNEELNILNNIYNELKSIVFSK